MAIVLPQGRFNNSSDKNIRDFIAARCRILAVVGLHGNTFKPHTGTKTSVLFVQKWNDDAKLGALCPRQDDYNIFFATMQKSGKDNSGEKIYRRIVPKDEEGLPEKEKERKFLLDPHDHLIVDHDLYNHEGLTEDGIAEAFVEFAKKEKFSFFEQSLSVTPFDPVKYQQLMDRLEAVELSLSDVLDENLLFRFDPEYFKKKYIELDKLLRLRKATYLSCCSKSIINFGAYSLCNQIEYLETGVPYINVADIGDNVINLDNVKLINESLSRDILHKSLVKENQILLTIAGTIGNASVAYKMPKYTNSNQAIANITLNAEISPFYISTFLNSKIGRNQTQRLIISNVQPNLLLTQVKLIKVVLPSDVFQILIEKIIKIFYSKIDRSKQEYQQAEDLLLSELGLKDWKPTEESFAIKSFSESFLTSDRLDAEYYQPKHQKVMAIMRQSGLCIGDVVTLAKRKFQPEKQGTFNYIEIGNLSGEGFANGEIVEMDEAPSRAQFIVKTNDIVTSTVRPIRRLSALIESEQNNYVCSSGFAVLKPTKIEPEVLLVYLRLPIVCEILDLHTMASMYPSISTDTLMSIPISLPTEFTRQQITEKVRASRNAREQSKQLLEIAKIGVERAIETDEATATDWIDIQL